MARPGWVAPLFTFTTSPVSAFTLLIFIAVVFSTVFFYEDLPHVPHSDHQHGLNLNEAYKDLQLIAARPHPYNSRQNDVVRSYLLDRLTNITKNHSNIRILNDQTSNVTIAKGQIGSYFEGNNLLVRIKGTDAMPAVLFSAHFDSVSTAPGATDDGMGIASLIQLVNYFTQNRPKRDVVFNFNNAEEDGLLGAMAFMAHPWSTLPTSFLNLEGAGGGGRALLFRTSSNAVAKAFRSVPHPHGNVITENSFERGAIRSDTDFTVYTKFGIPGLDLAFYKNRAVYHTKDDSVPTLAGKGALWNMLEAAFFSGRALAGAGNFDDQNSNNKAVYFDLFGEALIVTSLGTFFIINLILLIAGPILVATTMFFARRRSKMYWGKKGWIRFPIAFVLSAAAPVVLAFLVNWINPFIVYSSPYTLLAMQLSAAYIFLYLPLRILAHYRPVYRQKTIVLFELYIVSWALLVPNTVLVSRFKIGGFYFLTFFNAGILLSLLLGLVEHLELPPSVNKRFVKHIRRGSDGQEHVDRLTEEPTERTPLLDREEVDVRNLAVDEENQYILWIFQLIFAAPFTMILLVQLTLLLLAALRQTLADGSPSFTVYFGVGILSFLTMLPFAPFVHKFHRGLLGISVLILIVSALFNIFAFPFSNESPLKVYFKQTVDLDSGLDKVILTGVSPYLTKYIIPELPSATDAEVMCEKSNKFRGLNECSWESIDPAVAPGSPQDWINVRTSLVRPGHGRIEVGGLDTRYCNIYFDTPVKNLAVRGSSGQFLEHYPMPSDGLTQLNLWSRTFDRKFKVEFGWDGGVHLNGSVGCNWDDKTFGRIPALDEVIAFLPSWVTVSKHSTGLVEVTQSFIV